jgi:hypothetical protein
MALMIGYKPCGPEGYPAFGQSIDALLAAEGFNVVERGKDIHCGTFNDLEIVRAVYSRSAGERVFLVTHYPEHPESVVPVCDGCTFTKTCDHKVAAG